MSNLLELASIILTPTAYSADTLHCIKPNTATGDFNFDRLEYLGDLGPGDKNYWHDNIDELDRLTNSAFAS